MEEKPELQPIEALPQERWEHHEVIIMDPHIIIIRVNNLHDLISKNLVGGDISPPIRLVILGRTPARGKGKHIVK